jgi:hypothetical protein
MSYQLAISEKPGYLHVVVTGENSRQNVTRYMEDVIRECTLRQCFSVLIEERLEGPRLGTLEVFEMVAAGSTRFLRTLKAMAYVDVNATSPEMMRFAENVAVNRAFPVRMFATVAAAEKWLNPGRDRAAAPFAGAGTGAPKHRS